MLRFDRLRISSVVVASPPRGLDISSIQHTEQRVTLQTSAQPPACTHRRRHRGKRRHTQRPLTTRLRTGERTHVPSGGRNTTLPLPYTEPKSRERPYPNLMAAPLPHGRCEAGLVRYGTATRGVLTLRRRRCTQGQEEAFCLFQEDGRDTHTH